MTKVTANEVKDRLNHGDRFNITVVDSRAEHSWAESDRKAHNAVRIPPDADIGKYAGGLDRHDYIVTYCTLPQEASSTRVALALESLGFDNVHPLVGGFDSWEKANLPIEPK